MDNFILELIVIIVGFLVIPLLFCLIGDILDGDIKLPQRRRKVKGRKETITIIAPDNTKTIREIVVIRGDEKEVYSSVEGLIEGLRRL